MLGPSGRAITAACIATAIAAAGVIGGWVVCAFDAALLPYAGATVFMVYALVYRFALWVQRPPTAAYYRRGLSAMARPRLWPAIGLRCGRYLGANLFIWKRGTGRWAAHWPIMIGCLMAAGIAFPLVFGWLHFLSPSDGFDDYVMVAMGLEVLRFPHDSLFAFMLFHGLVWASVPVIVGVLIALRRRLSDRGDAAVQTLSNDLLPLLLLLAVAITGLALSASYTWLGGAAYDLLAVLHAATVIAVLVSLPFGKLLHVPQRSLKVAQIAYDEAAKREGMARCARCDVEYASRWQIEDLKRVEGELGYRYQLTTGLGATHWQEVCPRCRRALLVTAQSRRWAEHRRSELGADAEPIHSISHAPTPVLAEA